MEENRHGPERLGQITPKREKNRGKNNSSRVGVVLGNRCLEVLRGGCTLPPKPPLPSWSSSHPAKDLGWWHSCGWVSWAFQAFYPIGFGTIPLPAQPCLGCKHLGENPKLREKKGKHKKNQNQAPFSQVLPQLHGNFPADGKLWKSRVSARMNVSMFSPWCGHGCGVRAVRGTGAGMGMQAGTIPGMQARIVWDPGAAAVTPHRGTLRARSRLSLCCWSWILLR